MGIITRIPVSGLGGDAGRGDRSRCEFCGIRWLSYELEPGRKCPSCGAVMPLAKTPARPTRGFRSATEAMLAEHEGESDQFKTFVLNMAPRYNCVIHNTD